jgi:hypothetical protein
MLIGARPLRAASSMLLTSSVIMARMVANTWGAGREGAATSRDYTQEVKGLPTQCAVDQVGATLSPWGGAPPNCLQHHTVCFLL